RTCHVHVVISLSCGPDKGLRELKAWCTRQLKEAYAGRERWWTEGGSKRYLWTQEDLESVVVYVREWQERPAVAPPALARRASMSSAHHVPARRASEGRARRGRAPTRAEPTKPDAPARAEPWNNLTHDPHLCRRRRPDRPRPDPLPVRLRPPRLP